MKMPQWFARFFLYEQQPTVTEALFDVGLAVVGVVMFFAFYFLMFALFN